MGEGCVSFGACHNFGIDTVLVIIAAVLLMFGKAMYDGLRK